MKLNELLKMTGSRAGGAHKPCATRAPTGSGRDNQSTGIRGIQRRRFRTMESYTVCTPESPMRLIGSASSIEEALQMQKNHQLPPVPASGIKGVNWALTSWRGRVVINGIVYAKSGFKTPEDAAAWVSEVRAQCS